MTLSVALVTDALGLGGTEKGLVTTALALQARDVEVRAVILNEDGPRRAQLEQADIPVTVARGDRTVVVDALRGVDVVHVFRIGLADPLLPAARREAGVQVMVETNIFGQVDASDDEAEFDAHLFISRMTANRYRERRGLHGADFHRRHAVCVLPVDGEMLMSAAPGKAAAKAQLGLDPDRPVVTRTGRDDDRKWRTLLTDMVPPLLERRPDVQVLFVGATPHRMRRLAQLGVLERCHLLPLVPEAQLPVLYAASDVFVNAAEIGEAQGLVLQEAQVLGVPIVTCSTPWVDNAQIEVVDAGVDGHVAAHPQAFADAVVDALDPAQNARMGAAGRAKVLETFAPQGCAEQLERLYRSLLAGDGIPERWDPSPAAVDAFPEDYARRLALTYRPLTDAEQRWVTLDRARERARWAARAAMHLDRRSATFLLWQIRARLAGVRS